MERIFLLSKKKSFILLGNRRAAAQKQICTHRPRGGWVGKKTSEASYETQLLISMDSATYPSDKPSNP